MKPPHKHGTVSIKYMSFIQKLVNFFLFLVVFGLCVLAADTGLAQIVEKPECEKWQKAGATAEFKWQVDQCDRFGIELKK